MTRPAWTEGFVVTLVREGINKHRAREIVQGYWDAYCKDDDEAERLVQVTNEQIKGGITKKHMCAHTCPICRGNGLVPNGFYLQTSGRWSSTSTEPEQCRSCHGSGILWT